MEDSFIYQALNSRQTELENSVASLLSNQNSSNYDILQEQLNKAKETNRLQIAFVGQHNSGKSTVISALTHNKSIKISNKVETDSVEVYSWENVLLVDTPGLFAGEDELHDIKAKEAIEKADLLVYCITSSLFDDYTLRNFTELAYKKMYKSKMILLINKCQAERPEDGDYDQLIRNYESSLQKKMGELGADLNDFPYAFIDAKDYKEGYEDDDEELIEDSHFSDLIQILNDQIRNNQLLLKIDTRSHILKNIIEDELSETSADIDEQMLTVLRQMEQHILDKKQKAAHMVNSEIDNLLNQIRSEENKIVQNIGKVKFGKVESEHFNETVNNLEQKTHLNIQKELIRIQDDLNSELAQISESNRASFVFESIKNGSLQIDSGVMKDYSAFVNGFRQYSGKAKMAGDKAFKKLIGDVDLTKLANAKDTELYTYISKIGDFFNIKFKPWGIAKTTKVIGKVVENIGTAADIGLIVMDVGEKVLDESQRKKLQEVKVKVNNQVAEMANNIAQEIRTQYAKNEDELFNANKRTISRIKMEMITTANDNRKYIQALKNGYKETEQLIKDLNKRSQLVRISD